MKKRYQYIDVLNILRSGIFDLFCVSSSLHDFKNFSKRICNLSGSRRIADAYDHL